MSEPTLAPILAGRIYDVLVEHAGASDDPDDRAMFVLAQERGCTEYRFQGWLGFGGKFWHSPRHEPEFYVNCYPEHLTPDRRGVLERTNVALALLGRERLGP